MRYAVAVLLTVVMSAFPASSASAQEADGLLWACNREGAPSHREIAAAFGFNNWWFARNLQPVIYRELRNACRDNRQAVVFLSASEA